SVPVGEHLPPAKELIRAAGGLLWRTTPEGRKIAVIRRTRYGDWTLPKGKLNPHESVEAAALREVYEETGCRARILGPAGVTRYLVQGTPKTVTFFQMEFEAASGSLDPDEVGELAWLSPSEALSRLDHSSEADLLRRSIEDAKKASR